MQWYIVYVSYTARNTHRVTWRIGPYTQTKLCTVSQLDGVGCLCKKKVNRMEISVSFGLRRSWAHYSYRSVDGLDFSWDLSDTITNLTNATNETADCNALLGDTTLKDGNIPQVLGISVCVWLVRFGSSPQRSTPQPLIDGVNMSTCTGSSGDEFQLEPAAAVNPQNGLSIAYSQFVHV